MGVEIWNNQKLSSLAPLVLRLGMAGVVAWFGTSQIHNPSDWADLVPGWASDLSGLSSLLIVNINGWFEIIAALFLVLGFWVRWVGLFLALHLFVIASTFGFSSPTGIRDYGLSFALLSIFFAGQDKYCLGKKELVATENK